MSEIVVKRRKCKGENTCENIGCERDREAGKNKCTEHLAKAREYNNAYYHRRKQEQTKHKDKIKELQDKLSAVKAKHEKLQEQYGTLYNLYDKLTKPR